MNDTKLHPMPLRSCAFGEHQSWCVAQDINHYGLKVHSLEN